MSKFNFKLTFQTIYLNNYFLNLVLYWNYVPFISYMLVLVGELLFANNFLVTNAIAITVAVLGVLYQLYQWSLSFFTAQDVSMGYFGIPELTLQDLFSDWAVKFKLLIIRIVYYVPAIVIGLVVAGFGLTELVQIASKLSNLQGAISISLGLISGIGLTALVVMLINNTLLVAAQYQFSYTNNLLAAFNLVKIGKFVLINAGELLRLLAIQIVFHVVFFTVLLLAAVLLLVPIIGVLLFSILSGFYISWNTIFIPTLYGQIWGRTEIK